MILCVGEILADMIGKTEDGAVSYDRRAGGAPFNVACGVKKFGARSAFVGNAGEDVIGRFLQAYAREHVDEAYVSLDGAHNTTLAFVELDETGDRSFCFYRKDTADLHLPDVSDELLARAGIVHIGSLMLSEERGVRYAHSLAQRASKAGKLVSFDVNYRDDIFPDKARAVALYKGMLEAADIIKLSEEEYDAFGHGYVGTALKEKLVCVTLGAKGSMWRYFGRGGTLPSLPVNCVDTTGAGDAFYAGVLSQLDRLPREKWTDGALNAVFSFANVCGALTTQARGAIDALPTLEQIAAAMA